MAAIAHSPSFAKKAGVPQSVGRDFNEADKGRKFSTGGNMKKMAGGGSTIGKTGTSEKKGLTNEKMASVKTAAPSRDGVAAKGKTKGMMPKMKGNTVGNGPLVNVKGPAMKRGGKTK